MTRKAEFNAEEWSLLLAGPPVAGLRVVSAHRGGTIRESMAMGRVYAEARKERGSSELLDDIVAEQPAISPGEFKSAEEVREQGMARLRDAVGLLESKGTSQEVDDYKRFVADLAERVAGAHKEGGVLGIGGKPVSDEERVALDEINAALGFDSESS